MTKLDETNLTQNIYCPRPLTPNNKIILGHGSGGILTHELIKSIFLSQFNDPHELEMNDAAILELPSKKFALTTDTHVVRPIFFPGGDIGKLAICGTVNDLAMVGAQPKYITSGFIIEEGLDIDILIAVVESMKKAAAEANVKIIAGDTKVVEKGKADYLYINTAGYGILPESVNIRGSLAKPGDKVIVSGSLGDHGIAVLTARGDLGFQTDIVSDVAPLNGLVQDILDQKIEIHTMRDPTRGGLATTLNEIALQSNVCINIIEDQVPVKQSVRIICDSLGFDPLYIANEGKFIVIAPPSSANTILDIMKKHPYGRDASLIGEVLQEPAGKVLLKNNLGSTKILSMLSGELLPRIC